MNALREAAVVDADALRRRHPEVFDRRIMQRALAAALAAGTLALALFGFWRLDFSLARFGSGLAQIAHIVASMWPPSPGTQLPVFLHALAETLAIALIGTLTGAMLAFPLGLLAAKNVIPN